MKPSAAHERGRASKPLRIVILGLSITSSWGNGHATTYRALVRALVERGHDLLFLERDVPWYAANRDLPQPPYGRTVLYQDLNELRTRFGEAVRLADLVMVGSYVPEGGEVGKWVVATAQGVTAFYDIDTPVTLAKLSTGDYEYLTPALIPAYHLYLSFSGGPALEILERDYGAQRARPLYCAVDPALYYPEEELLAWTLGYMGTYSPDRQPGLEELLLAPARDLPQERFVVAGPNFPDTANWPPNIHHVHHLPPAQHRRFYNQQRFTLNLTRADMVRLGYSPSVRLFEASACGTPIISDIWTGIETFYEPEREILLARSRSDLLAYLHDLTETEWRAVGERALRRTLTSHTAAHRAQQLEEYFDQVRR